MNSKKNDILLILGLLLIAAVMWLFFRPGDEGGIAVITQNGAEIRRIDLSRDQTIDIASENQGFNTIVIENGEIYVSDANCGDHTCIRTGRISRTGEQIICLPHALVIEIVGGDTPELDASTH